MRYKRSIPLALSIALLLSAPVLAADWQPVFSPDKSVYVDPALSSSPSAPIKFGPELESGIKALHGKSGINYYVWALEAQNAPTDKPLGVTKANEAIAAWGSQANFPNDNYALIVWARRAENPAKGGIGVNLSSGLQKFDVAPIIKGKMPQNPKGAILAIAQTVADNKADAIAAKKAAEDFGNAAKGVMSFILLTAPWLFAGWLATIFYGKKKQEKAEADQLIEVWSSAVKNATDIYLELTADEALDFYGALYKEQGAIAEFLEESNNAISRFLCLYQMAKESLFVSEMHRSEAGYKEVSRFLNETVFDVNFGKLPLEKASVLNGLDEVQQYKGGKLLTALDEAAKKVLGYWAILKSRKSHESPAAAIASISAELIAQKAAEEERQRIAAKKAAEVEDARRKQAERAAIAELEAKRQRAKRDAEIYAAWKAKDKERASQVRSSSTTVFVDNSTHSSRSSSSSSSNDSGSSWSDSSSSDSGSSSSSDWGSSGSDYSSSDSGSFGSDY